MFSVDSHRERGKTPLTGSQAFTVHATTTTTTKSQAIVFGSSLSGVLPGSAKRDARSHSHTVARATDRFETDQALHSVDVDEARAVFDEDVNAFVEDQLRLACRLALAEEQLLSVAHSFKNSMSANKHGPDAWLDDLSLIGSVEEARGATQAVCAELTTSLVRLRRHGKQEQGGPRRQIADDEAQKGGEVLRTHLSAFHQESAVERNSRADLQAQWHEFKGKVRREIEKRTQLVDGSQFQSDMRQEIATRLQTLQSEMRVEIDTRMQNLEQSLESKLAGLRHAHEPLVEKVCNLQQQFMDLQNVATSSKSFSLAEGAATSQALDMLRDRLQDQMMKGVSEEIRDQIKDQVLNEAGLAVTEHRTHFDATVRNLEESIRGQESRMREIRDVLKHNAAVPGSGSTMASTSCIADDRAEVHIDKDPESARLSRTRGGPKLPAPSDPKDAETGNGFQIQHYEQSFITPRVASSQELTILSPYVPAMGSSIAANMAPRAVSPKFVIRGATKAKAKPVQPADAVARPGVVVIKSDSGSRITSGFRTRAPSPPVCPAPDDVTLHSSHGARSAGVPPLNVQLFDPTKEVATSKSYTPPGSSRQRSSSNLLGWPGPGREAGQRSATQVRRPSFSPDIEEVHSTTLSIAQTAMNHILTRGSSPTRDRAIAQKASELPQRAHSSDDLGDLFSHWDSCGQTSKPRLFPS